jgi:hypothetical protein
MAPIHRLEQGCAEIKGPLLAILPFLHALGSHETLSLLFIQNNLNALDGGLVIRNQQILKRIDAALGLFQFRDTLEADTAPAGSQNPPEVASLPQRRQFDRRTR